MTTPTAERPAWLAGLVVGAFAGFLALEGPAIGYALFAAFAVGAIVRGPRTASLAGLLIGTGAVELAILTLANASCASFDKVPGQDCSSPDLGPWLVAGGGLLAGGVLLSVALLIRAGRARRVAPRRRGSRGVSRE
jgi:hypothetical protein